MPRLILSFLSVCLVSCSQESKSERAAYEAALEAARYAIEAEKEKEDAIKAYQTAEAQAQAALAEAVQAEKAYEAAKDAVTQAEEDYSSESKEALDDDQDYKIAKAAQAEAYRAHQAAIVKNTEAYSKGSRSQQFATDEVRTKAWNVYIAAKAKTKKAEKVAIAKGTKKSQDSLTVVRKTAKDAKAKAREAKGVAERAVHVAQAKALEVKQAQAQAERVLQDVYMAAALAAFRHIAEEAIAEAKKKEAAAQLAQLK